MHCVRVWRTAVCRLVFDGFSVEDSQRVGTPIEYRLVGVPGLVAVPDRSKRKFDRSPTNRVLDFRHTGVGVLDDSSVLGQEGNDEILRVVAEVGDQLGDTFRIDRLQ